MSTTVSANGSVSWGCLVRAMPGDGSFRWVVVGGVVVVGRDGPPYCRAPGAVCGNRLAANQRGKPFNVVGRCHDSTVKTSDQGLKAKIQATGYLPELVWTVVETALAGEAVKASLVRCEPTMTAGAVGSHVTVLVVTPSRLIAAHIDDHLEDPGEGTTAAATTDAIALHALKTVGATYAVPSGGGMRAVTLAIGWGGRSRFEIEPARCGDPHCDGDHGYIGASDHDDIMVRVSEAGDGPEAVAEVLSFFRALSQATATR
jgi:hypothetical protein